MALRNWTFLKHLFGAIAFYAGCVLIFAILVRTYTKHGKSIQVPDLKNKDFSEAVRILDENDLEYVISDSIYDEKKPALTVIDQNPKPESKVKEFRTIYLTVNARSAPEVKMPDLKDASLKQATMILESYGMKVGKLIYKPDLAENVVLEQLNSGKPILPGSPVKKGSQIDLVIGNGLGQTEVEVPNLVGLSLREAKFVLAGTSLNLGAVVGDETVKGDSLDAIVYQQVPGAGAEGPGMINAGESVDVFITSDEHYETAGE